MRNFDEVALGYTPELAREEAARCLACKKPGCVDGCPVGIDIPGFIGRVAAGEFGAAIRTVKQTNALPAVCGRVCPQEEQCEARCVLGKKGDPVAIGRLERFVADQEAREGAAEAPPLPRPERPQPSPSSARARPASRWPPTSPCAATPSPCSRPCTRPAACSPTASPSSACPRPSCAARSTTCAASGSIYGSTSWSARRAPSTGCRRPSTRSSSGPAPACRGFSRSPART